MVCRPRDAEAELNLPPGFRFHPTDEELVTHYLVRKITSQRLPVPIIAEVDLYKHDPWQLPEMALFGQKEWYFFTPRDRKYPNGSRPNRAAGKGYWKATGADKPILPRGYSRPLGIKKALVFYAGKAPKGVKTDWIMHEYRLADITSRAANKKGSLRLDDWVLCRLYNKKNSWAQQQQQQQKKKEDSLFEGTMDSLEVFEDTGSESFRTPESGIENDIFPDFEDLSKPGAYLSQPTDGVQQLRPPSNYSSFQAEEEQLQNEDNKWLTDLNLDDFQSPFLDFGSAAPLDFSNQDRYVPALRPNQSNLLQF